MIIFNYKKAAMFGLDARIALAIFGALSVISGAALYNTREDVNAERYLQDLEAVSKAVTDYYLTTGHQITRAGGFNIDLKELLSDSRGLSSWNGPYINNFKYLGGTAITYSGGSRWDDMGIGAEAQKSLDWTGADTGIRVCEVGNYDCYLWYKLAYFNVDNTTRIFKKLDTKIDGGDGAGLGKIRFLYNTVYYQGQPYRYY